MMRYQTEKEKRMNEIEKEIKQYVNYDKYHDLSTATLKQNVPIEIKKAYDEWQKLFKEQQKEDSKFPFL